LRSVVPGGGGNPGEIQHVLDSRRRGNDERLLDGASELDTALGRLRVVSTEGIIASSSRRSLTIHAARTRLAIITALDDVKRNADGLDAQPVNPPGVPARHRYLTFVKLLLIIAAPIAPPAVQRQTSRNRGNAAQEIGYALVHD
jgi:hypothetical protein